MDRPRTLRLYAGPYARLYFSPAAHTALTLDQHQALQVVAHDMDGNVFIRVHGSDLKEVRVPSVLVPAWAEPFRHPCLCRFCPPDAPHNPPREA